MELYDKSLHEIPSWASCLQELIDCQIFLQVITVANICDPNSSIHLLPNMLQGNLGLLSSHSHQRWLSQQESSCASGANGNGPFCICWLNNGCIRAFLSLTNSGSPWAHGLISTTKIGCFIITTIPNPYTMPPCTPLTSVPGLDYPSSLGIWLRQPSLQMPFLPWLLPKDFSIYAMHLPLVWSYVFLLSIISNNTSNTFLTGKILYCKDFLQQASQLPEINATFLIPVCMYWQWLWHDPRDVKLSFSCKPFTVFFWKRHLQNLVFCYHFIKKGMWHKDHQI